MHLEGVDESELGGTIPKGEESIAGNRNGRNQGDSGYCPPKNAGVGSYEDEEELKAIFERTFGPVKRYKEPEFKRTFSSKSDSSSYYRNSSSAKKKEKEYPYPFRPWHLQSFAYSVLPVQTEVHGGISSSLHYFPIPPAGYTA